MMAEFLASLAAALSVFWGLKSALHHHWLLERHKAEQLRLLKYHSLLELAESSVSPELREWKDRLRHSIQQIERLEGSHLRKWLGENRSSREPARPGKSRLSDKYVKGLVEYYRRRRLDAQIAYFLGKAESEHERDWVTRLLPPLFFLVGIGFACAHFTLDLVITLLEKRHMVASPDWQHSVSIILIEAAAICPVLGSAIRTYRSAHESSRNTIRFRAAFIELERLSERLQMETDPAAILGHLRRCEEILEVEHRDWLQLMTEAEWFG